MRRQRSGFATRTYHGRTSPNRNAPRNRFNPKRNDALGRIYHLGRKVPN